MIYLCFARLQNKPVFLPLIFFILNLSILQIRLKADVGFKRIFGGQIMAQCLIAGYQTVEKGRMAHSFHSYFLRPGDFKQDIIFEVDRIRDGKSFTTRRVNAVQNGEAIFTSSISLFWHRRYFCWWPKS